MGCIQSESHKVKYRWFINCLDYSFNEDIYLMLWYEGRKEYSRKI